MTDQPVSVLNKAYELIIAFLLPGFIALAGVAAVNAEVKAWFGTATAAPTIAGFLFMLAAAFTLGILTSAVRWFVFEKARIWKLCGPMVKPAAQLDMSQRSECEATYQDLRHQHYYYYLAHANMAVAAPAAVVTWMVGTRQVPWPLAPFHSTWHLVIIVVATAAGAGILAAAACNAVARYEERRGALLNRPRIISKA